jgi:chromosomal replication initiation ATPase DnaA
MPPRGPRLPSDQLTLELASEPHFGAEDFLVSQSNEQAYGMIELWPDWPDPVLLLLGPPGAGKSHLAAIWAARAGAFTLQAETLASADLPGVTKHKALLIEDGDRLGGNEAALFHLLNLTRAEDATLLITVRETPELWGLATADLMSRLRLAARVAIQAPDDALMRAVLVKLLVDRQLIVDTNVVEYAALRLDRSLDAARDFVAALDREALSRGKRITRAMASDVLQSLEMGKGEAKPEGHGEEEGDGSRGFS